MYQVVPPKFQFQFQFQSDNNLLKNPTFPKDGATTPTNPPSALWHCRPREIQRASQTFARATPLHVPTHHLRTTVLRFPHPHTPDISTHTKKSITLLSFLNALSDPNPNPTIASADPHFSDRIHHHQNSLYFSKLREINKMESILARALEYTLKYWLKSFSRDQFKLQGRTAQLSNLGNFHCDWFNAQIWDQYLFDFH